MYPSVLSLLLAPPLYGGDIPAPDTLYPTLMPHKETQQLEQKLSLGEWKEIVESAAAFATATGGEIHIGIGPDGSRTGLMLGKGSLEDLANKIRINTDPPLYPSIRTEEREEKTVIIVRIEESPIKPVWAFGRPFKRVGRTNQRISRDETQRLMETTSGRTWDALPCTSIHEDEISEEQINRFAERAGINKTAPDLLLKNLGLLTNEGEISNGAVLLFATHPQRHFPQAQVKCGRFIGTDSIHFLDEQTLDGSLFEQVDRAIAFVARNTRQGIRIANRAEREILPEYPAEAVREAIVNAVCHRDYTRVGTVQIRIYDDRLEVWNPGSLPYDLTIEDLYHPHPSRPRNPRLAQALYRTRLIEQWGTGTVRMAQACREHGIEPEFAFEADMFRVRLAKTTLSMPASDRGAELHLKERQRKGLEYARKHGRISRQDYRKLTDISERQALVDLQDLVAKAFLAKKGSGRTTHYVPLSGSEPE